MSSIALAQQGGNAAQVSSSNLKARIYAPTTTDVNCAGFVTRDSFNRANFVLGGDASPHASKFAQTDSVFLTGSGYQEGTEYRIIRQVSDPNKNEVFPGQVNDVKRAGKQYADIALVKVYFLDAQAAVAKVEFSCQPVIPGDLVVPSQERASSPYPKRPEFQVFAKSSGGAAGKIIQANDFDYFLGAGQKVYLDLGSDKVKPGDYVRIVRTYEGREMPPVDRLVFKATVYEDTQVDAPKVTTADLKNFPRKGLGEAMVISANANSATAVITLSLEDIHIGDTVEVSR